MEVFANRKQCLAVRVYPQREDSIGVAIRAQGRDAKLKSPERVFDQLPSRTWKIGRSDHRTRSHGHRVAAIAEEHGNGPAFQIVDTDDANAPIDRGRGILSQDVAPIGPGLAPVDADIGLAPVRPNSARLQLPVRFCCDRHQPTAVVCDDL